MSEKIKLQRSHPWHGVELGDEAPKIVTSYIEIVPGDSIKYELDKDSGLLKIDRPQLYSNHCPALYGFLPRTFCGKKIAEFAKHNSIKNSTVEVTKGDQDPLDILVLTEKNIPRGDLLVQAIPIGGIRMIDKNEADDKIIAVLKDDAIYGDMQEITDIPKAVLERIRHYFYTYKLKPGASSSAVHLDQIYDRQTAYEVIRLAGVDYLGEIVQG